MLDAANAKNMLAYLLPTHPNAWWPLVEDIFGSSACKQLRAGLVQQSIAHGECASLSVDGTFKICLPLLGQGRFSDPAAERAKFPFADSAYSRVITVRGQSGAVLGLEPASTETGEDLAACLAACLPSQGLAQVRHIATDSPSQKIFHGLQQVCPNLEGMSLDPTHTAMRFEQACSGGRKTAGSNLLRQLMNKFTAFDPNIKKPIWGPMYDGADVASTPAEAKLRNQILDGSMPRARAEKVLKSCADLTVWPTRLQFVESLAAFACVHAADLRRTVDGTKAKGTVAKVLHKVTAADKAEWLLNNTRYRQFLPAAVRLLLPSGTTSNEALHAEMNNWFRQIQGMHRSTLLLKLQVRSLGKLWAHQVALHSPTCVQLPQMPLG